MKTGKAAVLDKPGGVFRVIEYPLPDPAPGTVLLRQELAGICGTDLHIYHGRMPEPTYPDYMGSLTFPVILGHENVGVIERLGDDVGQDFLGKEVQKGDRVAPVGAITCGKCYFCSVVGTPSRCLFEETPGFYPDPDAEPHFTGGFAQYLYLHRPGSPFLKTNLGPEEAVLLDTIAVAVHAVNRAAVRLGDTVVIQGSGPVGILTLICAEAAGATKAIVVGGPEERLSLAARFGAEITLDIEKTPDPDARVRLVRNLTEGHFGADVVFDCTGIPNAFAEGLRYTRNSGTFCEVGNFADTGSTTIYPGPLLVQKNVRVEAIYANTVEHFVRGLSILEKGEYPFAELVTHKLPLRRIGEAMSLSNYRLEGKVAAKIVVDPWV